MPAKKVKKGCIITGASSGIGRGIALKFASAGYEVFIFDINFAEALQVEKEVKDMGGACTALECNVADYSAVKSAVEEVASRAPIEVLINNAGIGLVGDVENTSEEDFDRLVAVNVKGVYNCIRHVVPFMKKNKKGVILNMASVAATVGLPERFAYSATKGAVLTMTYALARDYIPHGIRCNSISPARVHTAFVDNYIEKNYPGREKEMFEELSKTQPIGRMARPEEVANLALYLCSDEAAFITGCDYPLDGGFVKLNT